MSALVDSVSYLNFIRTLISQLKYVRKMAAHYKRSHLPGLMHAHNSNIPPTVSPSLWATTTCALPPAVKFTSCHCCSERLIGDHCHAHPPGTSRFERQQACGHMSWRTRENASSACQLVPLARGGGGGQQPNPSAGCRLRCDQMAGGYLSLPSAACFRHRGLGLVRREAFRPTLQKIGLKKCFSLVMYLKVFFSFSQVEKNSLF